MVVDLQTAQMVVASILRTIHWLLTWKRGATPGWLFRCLIIGVVSATDVRGSFNGLSGLCRQPSRVQRLSKPHG
jgi:hypothetical protein